MNLNDPSRDYLDIGMFAFSSIIDNLNEVTSIENAKKVHKNESHFSGFRFRIVLPKFLPNFSHGMCETLREIWRSVSFRELKIAALIVTSV